MKKYIFISKKNRKFYFLFLIFLLIIISIYLISIYIYLNQKYLIISNSNNLLYYVIPKDKEGEKVKFINKKGINNMSILNENIDNTDIDNLKYTIQLFSDTNFKNIDKYIKNILNPKFEIISTDKLYVFSIQSDIGTDYFLTYKNFKSRAEATTYCKSLSFIKKCLIINVETNNF